MTILAGGSLFNEQFILIFGVMMFDIRIKIMIMMTMMTWRGTFGGGSLSTGTASTFSSPITSLGDNDNDNCHLFG